MECSLFSYCPPDSEVTDIINRACNSINLPTTWCYDKNLDLGNPVYVAAFRGRKLLRGVTSSPIERVDLFSDGSLTKLIRSCDVVAVETNLTSPDLKEIVKIASAYGKRVCCMVVSDAKVDRITSGDFSHEFAFVSLNRSEAATLGFDPKIVDQQSSKEICRRLNSKSTAITLSKDGFVICNKDGTFKRCRPDGHVAVVSPIGAGDAFFAAACVAEARNESPGGDEFIRRVNSWTKQILGESGANLIVMKKVEDLSRTDRPRIHAYLSMTALFISLIFAHAFGGFSMNYFFYTLLLVVSVAGIAGSKLRDLMYVAFSGDSLASSRSAAIGATAGILAGLIAAYPNLATGDVDFVSDHVRSPFNIIAFGAGLSAFIAGATVEGFFGQLGLRTPKTAD